MTEDQIKVAFEVAARETIPPMALGHIADWWFRKGVAAAQSIKNADAALYRDLRALHDGDATLWHVRGADGQPIEAGGLDKSIDAIAESVQAA